MSRKFFVIWVVVFVVGCCVGCSGKKSVVQNSSVQTGDLLFVAIPMDYDLNGISGFAHQSPDLCELNFIHTAVLEVDDEGVWVIDATIKHGVARYPLDTFLTDFTLSDGSAPYFEVMRLKSDGKVAQYVGHVKDFIGEVYDTCFALDNGMHYCTELIYDAYQENGKPIFKLEPMDFKNSADTFPDYWIRIFAYLKMDIPQGKIGILPAQMRQSACLQKVDVDMTKQVSQ